MEPFCYKLYASSDAEALYLVDDDLPTKSYLYERELRELLTSTESLAGRWPESLLVFNAYADRRHLSLDFAMCQFVWRTAVSRQAMEVMSERLAETVEWLPIQLQDGREFFVPHPMIVADVLDTQKSAITYVSDYPEEPKYITSVHREWMRNVETLQGVHMFRTPHTLEREVYVSAEFAEFLRASGLSGMSFSPIQRSDDG